MNPNDNADHLAELRSLDLDQLLDRLPTTPNDVDLLICIGGQYLMRGQLDLTEEYYKRAIALDENDPWTHLYLGNLHCARGQYREALVYFTRALQDLSDVACVHFCLARVYEKLGKDELAGSHYRKAVAVDPANRDAKRHLDEWYERRYTPK